MASKSTPITAEGLDAFMNQSNIDKDDHGDISKLGGHILSAPGLKALNESDISNDENVSLLIGNERFVFESITLTHEQVEKYTRVHELNTRNSDTVTISSCEDLLPSIENDGVIYPVHATLDKDNVYNIFDGQRRRFCSIYAKKHLKILFTRENVSDDQIRLFSFNGNISKANSLYDKGRMYKSLQREGEKDNELASSLGIAPSQVKYAFDAYSIPLWVFKLFPSSTDIGRPTVTAVVKLIKAFNSKGMNMADLKGFCDSKEGFKSDKDALKALAGFVGTHANAPVLSEVVAGNFKLKILSGKKVELTLPDGMTMEQLQTLLASQC